MSRKRRQGIIVAGTSLVLVALLIVGLRIRQAQTQQADEAPAAPRLFAPSYEEGHELAGFTGRPMVLIFGDSRTGKWTDFLLECESDPKFATLLSERYQGVFVDAASDKETFDIYGNPGVPTVMLKDLRGPVYGLLQGAFSVSDILREMETALPLLPVERSPAYLRLLAGTDLLDELKDKEEIEEATRVLRLFKRYEGGTPAYTRAVARAQDLGIPIAVQ